MRRKPQQLLSLCFREQSLCLVDARGPVREEPLYISRLPGQRKINAFGREAMQHETAENPLEMRQGQEDLTRYFQWFLAPLSSLGKTALLVPIFHSDDTIHRGFWQQTFAPLKLKGLSLVSHLHCLKFLYAAHRLQGLAYFQSGLVETGISVKHQLFATQVMGYGRYLTRTLIRAIFDQHALLIETRTAERICQRLLAGTSPEEQLTVSGISRSGQEQNHLVIFAELLPLLDRAMGPIWQEIQHLTELLSLWGAPPDQDFALYSASVLTHLQRREVAGIPLILHSDDMILKGIQQCLKTIQAQNLYSRYF